MWPSLPSMLESNISTQDKISYLRTISFCQNMSLQNEEDVKILEKHIQKLINSPLTRYDGLLLWNCALSKSNLYLPNWGKILAAGLQCNDSFAVKEQCSIVLKKIILVFGRLTEYSGAFQRFLPELIPILMADSETNQGFVNSCESLTVCMTHLPQLLGSYMVEIETFVLSNLDTDSVQTIETLSDLFSTFPRCLEYTFKPKVLLADIYLTTFRRTVNTLHTLLNDILSFQNDNLERVDKLPKYEILCQAEGGIPLMFNKIRTFASLSHCLAKLMSCETGRVRAAIEDLLELVARVFVFDFNVQVKQDSELVLLFLSFPKICDAAFILLEALVLNFSVDEQASGIMFLIMKVVNISRTSPNSVWFYSQVRSTIWKFLNIWIHQSGCKVMSEIVSSKLVKELLIEIAVHSTEINDQTSRLFQYSRCVQALKALANLYLSGGCFLEDKDIEDITTTILRIVRQVQLHLNPSKSFPSPYCNEECRMELYNLLLTCCISGNPSQMKYTLKSVNLFKIALRDPSIKVKEVCHRSFAFCRYYLHPKKPPPEHMIQPKPAKVNPTIEEDELLDVWGTGWPNKQINGHAPAAENVANSSYPEESSFSEAMEASEMTHDEQTEQDSPPRYTELGPVNAKKTFSQQSSHSYGDDSDSDDDKDSSFDDDDEHPPRKRAYEGTAPRARPTIQILETQSTSREQQQAEDSLELGATVEKAMPELSDGYEEDIAMAENGEPEESDEEEYMDEEDEGEVDEDDDADYIEERQLPEIEEPPTKKQRVETGDFGLEEESSLMTEKGEVAKTDECQGVASNISHQEAIGNIHQEAVGSGDNREAVGCDEHQEAVVCTEHQEAISCVERQDVIGNVEGKELVDNDLQGFDGSGGHKDLESDNRQGTLSNDGHENLSNDGCQEEVISHQEINGENEDSEDSSSNEVIV